MSLELQGDLLRERAPTQRWISFVAVALPAVAFVLVATWFIRAYIAPPTITIAGTMRTASAAPQAQTVAVSQPPAVSAEAALEARFPETTAQAAPAPAMPSFAAETPAPPSTLPMLDTLTVAPPAAELPDESVADATTTGVAQDTASEPVLANAVSEASLDNAEPVAEPIPLPRVKPRFALAVAHGPVPLPRPKPVTEAPPPDLPATDVHAIQ